MHVSGDHVVARHRLRFVAQRERPDDPGFFHHVDAKAGWWVARMPIVIAADQRADNVGMPLTPVDIVGVVELSTAAGQVNSRTVAYPAEVFGAVAVLYFLLCSGIEALPNWLRATSTPQAEMSTWKRFLRWRARPVADAVT